MSTNNQVIPSGATEERYELHRNWPCFLALGVALIVAGLLAISYPVAATLTTVEVFGFLLLFGGVVEIISGFWTRRWGGLFLHLLGGLLYLFLGAMVVERPGLGAAGYTLALAVFFVATGLFRLAFALSRAFPGRSWALVNGVVTLILGVMIWRDLPASALWVIGTFVGVDLTLNGWSWVMLALEARSFASQQSAGQAAPGQIVGV